MRLLGPLGERSESIFEDLPAFRGEFEFYGSYLPTPEFISRRERDINSQESPAFIILCELGNNGVALTLRSLMKAGILTTSHSSVSEPGLCRTASCRSGSYTLFVCKDVSLLDVVIVDSRDMLPDDVSEIGFRTGRNGDHQ
jgi:hypothetical protein